MVNSSNYYYYNNNNYNSSSKKLQTDKKMPSLEPAELVVDVVIVGGGSIHL